MELREISREEHEYLLDLFIMAFADYRPMNMNFEIYKYVLYNTDFQKIKDCFPMDEVCEQELFSNNRECYYKAINWIKEV